MITICELALTSSFVDCLHSKVTKAREIISLFASSLCCLVRCKLYGFR